MGRCFADLPRARPRQAELSVKNPARGASIEVASAHFPTKIHLVERRRCCGGEGRHPPDLPAKKEQRDALRACE